jgi:pyruvate,water dikinase
VESTDPDWFSLIEAASGILTSQAGRLCHAAITARELKKPCIVGLGDKVLELSGKIVSMDGLSGKVTWE